MTAFSKSNGDYHINGYTFTSSGIVFPDGSVQASAGSGSTGGTGGTSGPVTWTSIIGKPTFSTVATSGSYNDLTNKPTLFSGSYNDLTNKPNNLASVSYVDTAISDVIGSAPIALNTLNELAIALGNDASFASTITNTLATKVNTSSLSSVATSGYYSDLLGKPTIPTVPTTISSFTNDAGYITSASLAWANISGTPTLFSGSYADLTNKPTIPTVPTVLSAFTNDLGLITSASLTWSNISGKPTLFSGSYADLTDKPTIPSIVGLATETYVNTQVSNLVNSAPAALDTLNELATALGNDSNFATTITNSLAVKANTSSLATVATSGSYTDLTNKPTIPTVPTTVGSFTNNVGYITASSLTWSNISSKPNFATVATSGSYNDLTTKAALDDLSDVTITDLSPGQAVIYAGTTVSVGGTFTSGSSYSSATWNKNSGDVVIYGITSTALSSALVPGSSITIAYPTGNNVAIITSVSNYLNDYTVVIDLSNSTGSAQTIQLIDLPVTNQTTYSWKNSLVETLSPFLLMGA